MIVTDINKLNVPCEPCSSVEEGEEIGAKLLHELTHSKVPGIGLAANQIGINKRVCVINVKEPVVLINPEIIEKSEEKFLFMEGCLSFDKQTIKTTRHQWLKVKADNYESTLYFGIWKEHNKEGYNTGDKLSYALETACVQHEIDHLDGITMFDRQFKGTTLKRVEKKIGRNDKVTITKDTEFKTLKYKKAEAFLKDGWTLTKQ